MYSISYLPTFFIQINQNVGKFKYTSPMDGYGYCWQTNLDFCPCWSSWGANNTVSLVRCVWRDTVCNSRPKNLGLTGAIGDCWSGSIWKSVLCHFRTNANGDISFWRVLKWSLLHLLCARTTWFRVWHARMHGVDSVRLSWLFTSSGEFLPQGIFWKSSLQPCLDVSNWDASSMRCRHWCCGIITAYLGHVLKWSLLHLLCARTTWFRVWHARMRGVDSVRLGWLFTSSGEFLPQGIFWKSSLQPCLDVSNWDASSMRCRHWCCGITTAYLGHVLKWSLLHLLCARTTWFRVWHARMHGVDSVRLGWLFTSSGEFLPQGIFWKSSLQPCLDVSNWDASSMRCRHWCCGIITSYLGHVLKWSLLHLLCARTTWFRVWHARMHGVDSVRLSWLFTSSGEFLPQGIFWKSSLQPCLDVSNWDASSMRCRHWCCGIITAYLGHVLKWSLLHLLCARTTWFRVWHARMRGVDSVRLGWLFTSSGEFLPQGIFWKSSLQPCLDVSNWDASSMRCRHWCCRIIKAYLGHVLKWSLLHLFCRQGSHDSVYGMPECMVWIPFVWAGSSQALANSFRGASFESLLFCPFRMYSNWGITSIEKHSLIYGVFFGYDGHVFKWSCPKEVIPFLSSEAFFLRSQTFYWSLFRCRIYTKLFFFSKGSTLEMISNTN